MGDTYMMPAGTFGLSPTFGDAGYVDIEALTPDALLTYCATQIKSIDEQIDEFMKAQKEMMKVKEILQKLKNGIEGNNTVHKSAAVESQNKVNVANEYLEAYDALKEEYPELAEKINQEFKEWYPNGDLSTGNLNTEGNAAPTTSDSEFQEKVGNIQSMVDDLGKDMELNMIRLQSDMSKRQTAIQLTTNILDKYNKGIDQIVANMK